MSEYSAHIFNEIRKLHSMNMEKRAMSYANSKGPDQYTVDSENT